MSAKRDHKAEYEKYGKKYDASPARRKARAGRVKANRLMIKAGKASKGDGKDIHHKNRNTSDNSLSNLAVADPKKNRGWRKGKKGPAKGK